VRASFVLHLDTAALARGELRGDIEEVASGRRAAIHGAADLTAFLIGPRVPVPESGGSAAGAGGVTPR
jgi:hypothetical protein